MKTKFLSGLLAVTMIAGMAVPAFAATSDLAGDAKKVSKITTNQKSYEIAVNKSVDFADEIKVFENNTKLILDHNHIQYSIVGDSRFFSINDSVVTALKAGGEATLTIWDNYSQKARAEIKLVSKAPEYSATTYAESFSFEKSNYEAIYNSNRGTSEGFSFKVVAHPNGSVFKAENVDTVKSYIQDSINKAFALNLAAETSSIVTGVVSNSDKTITFDFSNANAFNAGATFTIGSKSIVVKAEDKTIEAQIKAIMDTAESAFFADWTADAYVDGSKKIVLNTTTGTAPTAEELKTNATIGKDVAAMPEATYTLSKDGKSIVVNVPVEALASLEDGDAVQKGNGTTIKTIDGANKLNGAVGSFTATTSIRATDAVAATSVRLNNTADVKVGDTVTLTPEFFPYDANVGKNIQGYSLKPYYADGKAFQHAIVEQDGVNGIVTGVNSNDTAKTRVVATFVPQQNSQAVQSAECDVTVKSADFNAEAVNTIKLSSTDRTIKVGEKFTLSVINLPKDVTVKWSYHSVDSKGVAFVNLDSFDKAVTNVFGKNAGKAVVTATLSNGEVLKCNVTVEKAPLVTNPKPEEVPQTSDNWFTNLF